MQRWHAPVMTVLLGLLFCGGCQRPGGDVADRLIIGEVMMNSQFAENLRELCQPGGRLSGTENGLRAERFVAKRLRAFGLSNVQLEPFEMPGWQVNHTKVTALSDPPLVLTNPIALWNTQSTPPAGITAVLIDAGEGSQDDFDPLGDAVAGKFVLIRGGKRSRGQKIELALQRGAVGVIAMGEPEREPVIGRGHPAPRPEPAIAIRYDDGEKLAEMLAAGDLSLNVEVQADIWAARPHNVVGEIPGRGPLAHQIVILCAHLDSWHLAEGAIDNGNGAAAILETARALSAIGWQPRRTLRFVWFMGEEQNLYGSRAYVTAHADELDDVVAVVNVDMPGSPRRFVTFGHPEIVGFLESVAGEMRAYELSDEVRDYSFPGSDHAPFMDAGVCAVSVFGELGDGAAAYHTINDVYDGVDRRATVQSSAVLGVLIRRLADSSERPGVRRASGES